MKLKDCTQKEIEQVLFYLNESNKNIGHKTGIALFISACMVVAFAIYTIIS